MSGVQENLNEMISRCLDEGNDWITADCGYLNRENGAVDVQLPSPMQNFVGSQEKDLRTSVASISKQTCTETGDEGTF